MVYCNKLLDALTQYSKTAFFQQIKKNRKLKQYLEFINARRNLSPLKNSWRSLLIRWIPNLTDLTDLTYLMMIMNEWLRWESDLKSPLAISEEKPCCNICISVPKYNPYLNLAHGNAIVIAKFAYLLLLFIKQANR